MNRPLLQQCCLASPQLKPRISKPKKDFYRQAASSWISSQIDGAVEGLAILLLVGGRRLEEVRARRRLILPELEGSWIPGIYPTTI